MKTITAVAGLALAVMLSALAATSTAQSHSTGSGQAYPNKPMRVVVPWPAGGITDVITRAIGQHLADVFGQQVVVDNRPGAGGTLGAAVVANAAPDGYTLLIGVAGPLAVGPSVYAKLGYDSVKDFAPIARFAAVPYLKADIANWAKVVKAANMKAD